jgi:hypothetical protein
MSSSKQRNIKEQLHDPELKEILEIVEIAKQTQEATEKFDDKTRPIIDLDNQDDEVNVIQFVD